MKFWFHCALCALCMLAGCNKKSSGEPDTGIAECSTPGSTFDCSPRIPCPGSQSGTQLCRSDGTLSTCQCPSAGVVQSDAGRPTGSDDDAGTTTAHDAGIKPPADAGAQMDASPHDAGTAHDAGTKHDTGAQISEDCGNGVDDDGDGKIDCADDDCGERTCLPSAPDGWEGPSLLYVGDDATPTCRDEYPSAHTRGGTAVNASPAECSSCSCQTTGAGCGGYLYFGFGSDSCANAGCSLAVSSSCIEVANSCLDGLTSAHVQTELPPDASHCTPSAQTPTLADPTFTAHVLACGSDSLRRGGCDPGDLCAPKKAFDGPFCIVKSGDVACPPGAYSDHRVYFAAIDDTRDCSACSCGSDCSYTWNVYADDDTACSNAHAESAADQCVAVSPMSGKIRVGAAISGSGACSASGGEASGDAKPSDPFTACCLP